MERSKVTDALLKDLTEGESSLFDAWRLTRKLQRRPVYRIAAVATFLLVLGATICSEASPIDIARQARDTSSSIFGFVGAILGIVIAGFAIFTAVATTAVVPALSRVPRKDLGISELKFMTLHFVAAFIPFLAFIPIHIAILAVGWFGGPMTTLARLVGSDASRWAAAALLSFLAGYALHLTIVLQQFVFNVYMAFMTIARATIELQQDENGPPPCARPEVEPAQSARDLAAGESPGTADDDRAVASQKSGS